MNTLRALLSGLMLMTLQILPVPAIAETAVPQTLPALQQQLSDTRALTGSFTQIRELKLLSKPLVSRGSIYYQKDTGICWQLTSPVAASVYLTRDKVSVADSASSSTTTTANPLLQAFSHLLFAVFAGDLAMLEHQFDVTMTPESSGWQLTLLPENSLMSSVAESIKVTGSSAIKTVKLFHPGGDSTTLSFSDILLNPGAIPPALTCHHADSPA